MSNIWPANSSQFTLESCFLYDKLSWVQIFTKVEIYTSLSEKANWNNPKQAIISDLWPF